MQTLIKSVCMYQAKWIRHCAIGRGTSRVPGQSWRMPDVMAVLAAHWCGVGDRGITAARSRGEHPEVVCLHFGSASAGCASPWGVGWEVGPVHGWPVVIHGTAFPNNLQKLLGWFQLQPNISSSAAPRPACYPEEAQVTAR